MMIATADHVFAALDMLSTNAHLGTAFLMVIAAKAYGVRDLGGYVMMIPLGITAGRLKMNVSMTRIASNFIGVFMIS